LPPCPQDNREERTFGAGKSYQFMMRTRQPAGTVTNQLYLVMDELANLVGGVTAGGGGVAWCGDVVASGRTRCWVLGGWVSGCSCWERLLLLL